MMTTSSTCTVGAGCNTNPSRVHGQASGRGSGPQSGYTSWTTANGMPIGGWCCYVLSSCVTVDRRAFDGRLQQSSVLALTVADLVRVMGDPASCFGRPHFVLSLTEGGQRRLVDARSRTDKEVRYLRRGGGE